MTKKDQNLIWEAFNGSQRFSDLESTGDTRVDSYIEKLALLVANEVRDNTLGRLHEFISTAEPDDIKAFGDGLNYYRYT
jgi:hypothetical protein